MNEFDSVKDPASGKRRPARRPPAASFSPQGMDPHSNELRNLIRLAEHAKEVFWILDPQSPRIVYVNPAFEQVWGLRREEVYRDGRLWLEAVFPEDMPAIEQTQQQLRMGQSVLGEYRIRRPDGQVRWIRDQGLPIQDHEGRVVRVVGLAEDITERRQAEQLLMLQRDLAVHLSWSRELTDALRDVLDAALKVEPIDNGAIFLLDRDSGAFDMVVSQNLSTDLTRLTGHFEPDSDRVQLIQPGRPIYCTYADVAPEVVPERVLAEEKLRAFALIPVVYDQRVVATLNLASRTCDDLPQAARHALETIAAQIGRVFARLETDTILNEQRANLRQLFEEMSDFLFILDAQGHIINANPPVFEKLGYTPQELIGAHVVQVHPPALREEVDRVMERIMRGETNVCMLPLNTRDGREIPVETRISTGKWNGQEVVFGISRDVSRLLEMTQALAEARNELEQRVDERTAELSTANERLTQEIAERQQAEHFLRIQRDLGAALSSSVTMKEAFDHVLEACFGVEGVDIGAVYVLDDQSREMVLTDYRGLSNPSSKPPERYAQDSPEAQVFADGRPNYERPEGLSEETDAFLKAEQIQSAAAFPVIHEGALLAVICVASRARHEISANGRHTLEAITAMAGGLIARIRTEQAWRLSEQEKSVILDSMSELVVHLDRDMRICWSNRAGAHDLNLDADSLVGRYCYELYAQSQQICHQCPVARCMSTGRREEGETTTPDGRSWVITGTPLFDEHGQISGAVEVAREITEQKRAELALRQSEEQLRQAHDELEQRVVERTAELTRTNRQLQQEIAERKRIAETLRENREAEHQFQARLTALLEVSSELSQSDSFDELCYRAVSQGRERLGFDRLGLWFVDGRPNEFRGSYGTDENGRVRDERHRRISFQRPDVQACLASRKPVAYRTNGPLYDDAHHVVGQGERTSAAIWNGREAVGYIACDNQMTHRPITPYDSELLALYASVIGHQCLLQTRKDELKRSEAWNRALVEAMPDMFFRYTRQGVTVAFKPALGVRPFMSEAEFMHRPISEILPADVADLIMETIEKVFATGQMQVIEYRLPMHEEVHDYEGRMVICGENEVLLIVRDITDRKRAERALRESEELYRSLYDTALVGLWRTRISDGLVLRANRTSARLTGYNSPQEMIGKVYAPSMYGPGQREELMRMLERDGEIANTEMQFVLPDGQERSCSISARMFKDKGYIEGAIVDITETKRLQQQLIQTQKLESIGTLAGGIAHDFNNLLAVVLGNASALLRRESVPGSDREMIEDMIEAAERGSALTQQLLAYARGGLQKPKPCALNMLIERVLKILRRTAPSHIELAGNLADELPPVVADPSQLEQVIMNLVLNAIQAMQDPGRIDLRTRVESLDDDRLSEMAAEITPGKYVVFEVRDSGCGMDAVTLGRIYEPFFTTKFTGRGMGLSATLGIVQSNKGYIDVQSEVGRGTTMTVYLPAAEQEKPAADPAVEPRTMGAPRGTETILVIDDEVAVGRTVEKILAPLGYMVIPQSVPKVAAEFIKVNAEDIDLILLDLNMPGISGPEMYRTIQHYCPEKPVVLISGYDSPDTVHRLQADGAGPFVQKPFSIMTLATVIRNTLDEVAAPDAVDE